MKIKKLLILLLFNNLIYCGPRNYLLMMLNNTLESHKSITKQDILNNKQITHLSLRDFIIKVHFEIEKMPQDHKDLNQKLFKTVLARKQLTYEEIINYKEDIK